MGTDFMGRLEYLDQRWGERAPEDMGYRNWVQICL